AGVTVLLTLILTRRQDVLAEDTAVGVVFAGLFPAGVLLFALQANVDRSLDSFLFGDLLGVSGDDLVGSTLLILLGLAILAGTYRPLVATSYGRAFTSSLGYRPLVVDAVLLALVALCMVVAMQAIGNVLASALLIVPAATSRLLSRRLLPMMLLAAALGGGACLGGIELSYWCGLAGGSAVVLCAAAAFAVTLGARLLGGGLARTPSGAAALP
ncbi:MAG TPA: metal ABC transporter permease, partial [Solirubrobacteraceae bacterium]|nr:metal ABC transporter permease [Solirubrobacteraceae bacterium]